MENAIARNSEPPKLKPVEMESLILNQLASVGQKPVADAIGIDESTISRWGGTENGSNQKGESRGEGSPTAFWCKNNSSCRRNNGKKSTLLPYRCT